MNLIELTERGVFPDVLVRAGMRKLISQRLTAPEAVDGELRSQHYSRWLAQLRASPIAVETQAANQQHYEVPAEFFALHLGPRLKYSCALYPQGNESLAEAEEEMFALYAERAELRDGMRIMDLGCGWDRCRCGWPSAIRMRRSSACRTRMGNANSSRRVPANAASATCAC